MKRIESIRNATRALPSVERTAVGRRVERQDPRDEDERRRRRTPRAAPPSEPDAEPAGPDADGHIDVTV